MSSLVHTDTSCRTTSDLNCQSAVTPTCIRYSLQLARSPLFLKSLSSNRPWIPVFSHILRISDMQSFGLALKNSFPALMVRLCCFQSQRYWSCWLSNAEKAYMLEGRKKREDEWISKQCASWFYLYCTLRCRVIVFIVINAKLNAAKDDGLFPA